MGRRIFIACLNKQRKLYNQTIGSLVGGSIGLLMLGASFGLLYGAGGAAIGFIVGNIIDNEWFRGNIQRKLYWYLPFAKEWLDRNIGESSDSNEV